MSQNSAIVPCSLRAISTANNTSIAESFVNCDTVIIFDTSGSMGCNDSRGGQRRYDIASDELAKLQGSLPGKIAVLAFSDNVMFCPDGKPFYFGLGTDLAKALRFAKVADLPKMRFILISDGEPDDERDALSVARTFKNKIDVIYVGSESSPSGREFLTCLAHTSGGTAITADRAQGLLEATKLLLLEASK